MPPKRTLKAAATAIVATKKITPKEEKERAKGKL
jgi:hypothetical protein